MVNSEVACTVSSAGNSALKTTTRGEPGAGGQACDGATDDEGVDVAGGAHNPGTERRQAKADEQEWLAPAHGVNDDAQRDTDDGLPETVHRKGDAHEGQIVGLGLGVDGQRWRVNVQSHPVQKHGCAVQDFRPSDR